MQDRVRARKLVKAAAKQSRGSVRKWLLQDENAVWEREALHFLKLAAEKQPELSEPEVDRQVATVLAYLATVSTLRVESRSA